MEEKKERQHSNEGTLVEEARPRKKSFIDIDENQLAAAFENPLSGIPKETLFEEVETFCRDAGLMEHLDDFKRGALVAQNPQNAHFLTELSEEDRNVLEREHTHRWSQPFMLYWLVVMCSLSAAVQGSHFILHSATSIC